MDEINVNAEEQLAEQARIRREKLKKLAGEGANPYLKTKYAVTARSQTVKDGFDKYEGKEVSVAGRLMSRRIMGKASFSHISDGEGQLQVCISPVRT